MPRTSFRVNPHSIVCQNVKDLLARSRRHIWNLSDNNGIQTHNHLVPKQSLDHLSKLVWAGSSLTFRQTIECRFPLEIIRDMIITYSQMHRTEKLSQYSLIIALNVLWAKTRKYILPTFQNKTQNLKSKLFF